MEKAAKIYSFCASKGFTKSIYCLAQLKLKGLGVKKNEEEAYQLFFKAHENGHIPATVFIANNLMLGRGCKVDKPKALELFISSYKSGNNESRKKIEEILSEGNTDWNPQLHIFWKSKPLKMKKELFKKRKVVTLDQQIECLLLVSKFRSRSSTSLVQYVFVKGVVIIVVKHLANLRQSTTTDETNL